MVVVRMGSETGELTVVCVTRQGGVTCVTPVTSAGSSTSCIMRRANSGQVAGPGTAPSNGTPGNATPLGDRFERP